jgi:hypothetical protein
LQAIVAAIIIIERPRKASLSLLLLFTSLLLEQLITLSHRERPFLAKDVPCSVAPAAATLGIVLILNMPLRDPTLPSKDISPAFSTPTVQLRTPEDNLTPWQYMTVSWMEPLIKKGVTRQMEDEDIWDLGWDFKHARLHDAFRKLQGSVTKRVFAANGMDLIRTTALNVVRLCASKYCIPFLCLQSDESNISSSSHTGALAARPRFHGGQEQQGNNRLRLCYPSLALDIRSAERFQSLVSEASIREM